MKKNTENNKGMANKIPIYSLMTILVMTTLVSISSRLFFLGNTALAGGDKLWQLNITASINSIPNETTIKIHPPLDTKNIVTIQRNISYPGFRIRKPGDKEKYQRSINVNAIAKGRKSISTDYLLHEKHKTASMLTISDKLPTETREKFLLDSEQLQFKSYTVNNLLKKLLKEQPSQEQLIYKIYRYSKSIPIFDGADSITVPQVISRRKATVYDRTLVMISLSRAAGIPARLVSGLILKEDIETLPHYWAEIYHNGQWSSYDVFYGYKNTVPHNYLPIRRDNKNIFEVNNGTLIKLDYELEQEFNHPYIREKQSNHFSAIFNLTRLPINVRDELALLLLLPLGALITALFRHLVGVQSYGVFTPTLLALAIVYANIITTIIVFIVVIVLAIWGMKLFPSSLSRIPRLSIIFTLIALIMAMSVSVLNYYDIDQDGKIILLPIIILTAVVDRLYRTIDEYGMKIAMNRMAWTLLITILCLPVIQFETLGNLILEYPEIHFTTLALFLLVSTYKGEKLISLPVLKILAEPKTGRKKQKSSHDNN